MQFPCMIDQGNTDLFQVLCSEFCLNLVFLVEKESSKMVMKSSARIWAHFQRTLKVRRAFISTLNGA